MQNFESKLHLSKQFILFYTTLFLGSAAIVFSLPWVAWIKLLLAAITLCYGIFIVWKNHQWQAVLHHENGWAMRSVDELLPILLCADSTVTRLVSILRFTVPQKRLKQSCIIFNDAMQKTHYRQLTVRLRSISLL